MSFTPDTYAIIRDGCLRSARTVVPTIMGLLNPSTVLDIGCGEGWWLSVFAERGCDVRGVDGGQPGHLAIAADRYTQLDLATCPATSLGTYDVALSLEVAEHLPEHRAEWLIEMLCNHAPAVVFSAAIPGQGGTGHCNEQWPGYWATKFEARGYQVSGALRWYLWDLAPDLVENWYAQNILLCMREPGVIQSLFDGPAARPFPIVHPVLWDSRR